MADHERTRETFFTSARLKMSLEEQLDRLCKLICSVLHVSYIANTETITLKISNAELM